LSAKLLILRLTTRGKVRVDLGLQGGLVHEGADGVVDQQVRPDLLADPVGIAAA
jgi:hypothetical protein